jgi:hypothetical protein
MKRLFGVLVLVTLTGCGGTTGVPTEFANACNPDNEKKYIEVGGVLAERGSVFCSSTGGRMECGFDLLEAPGSDKKLRVDVEQGSGANTVDKLERGYKKEDVKIRDNAGSPVALGADKVKLTGKMNVVAPVGNAEGICFMQVTKVER